VTRKPYAQEKPEPEVRPNSLAKWIVDIATGERSCGRQLGATLMILAPRFYEDLSKH
jgi:hypothetical protein